MREWVKANPIPSDQERVMVFGQANDRSFYLLYLQLKQAAESPETPLQNQYGTFYAACMNAEQANRLGAKPLQSTLAAIDALRNRAQIATFLGNINLLGAGLLSMTVLQDDKDAQRQNPTLRQDGLTLPTPDYYLKTGEQQVATLAGRIVHIGNRKSDIYELFSTAHQAGTHFLLRTCVDRLAGRGDHTIADEMSEVKVQGRHRVEVRDSKNTMSEAVHELRYRRIRVLAPVAKQKLYPPLMLTVLHATERDAPKGRDRIDWKLVTDLPIKSRLEAVEKLNWYAMRWKIETFHKILKSGCKAEDVKLRTAERFVNLIAILCLLSWRVFWMTMLNRTQPETSPEMALTPTEIYLLDQLVKDKPNAIYTGNTLALYLAKLARLAGYLALAKDPPPVNTVIWRGLTRLTDIQLGFILGTQVVGIERYTRRLLHNQPVSRIAVNF